MRNIAVSDDPAIRESAQRLREYLTSLARRMSLRDPMTNAWAEEECPPAQARTIWWLGIDGALTMGDLARRLSVTEKTITGIVDRCEKDGYVQRERAEDDRRVVRVVLTERGKERRLRFETLFMEKITNLMGLLDTEDREAMFRILDKLGARLLVNDAPVHRQKEPQEKT